MKKLVVGAVLFISGVIGAAAVIISCAVTAAAYGAHIGVHTTLTSAIFEGVYGFSLTVPFVISVLLSLSGAALAASGFRGGK